MSIAQFIALTAGLLSEFALLFYKTDIAHNTGSKSKSPNFIAILTIEQRVFLFGGVALLLSIVINQLSNSLRLFESLSNIFTLVAGLAIGYILISALFDDRMSPRVNEQQMFIVHLVVTVNLLINQTPILPNWAMWLLLIPTVALFAQAVWLYLLPLTLRAIFYFWYIIMLLVLAFQNGSGDYFEADALSMPELTIVASLMILLSAHFLLALRFLIIIPSLIFPRNRPLLQIIMPRLMRDEQMSPTVLALVVFVFAALLAINQWQELVLDQTLINLLILAVTQFPNGITSRNE